MAKYINADEIDYKIISYPRFDLSTGMVRTEKLDGVYAFKTDIDAMPAADVQEIKHATWEIISNYKVECTNCHYTRNAKTQYGWNFCPHCGAKISLED